LLKIAFYLVRFFETVVNLFFKYLFVGLLQNETAFDFNSIFNIVLDDRKSIGWLHKFIKKVVHSLKVIICLFLYVVFCTIDEEDELSLQSRTSPSGVLQQIFLILFSDLSIVQGFEWRDLFENLSGFIPISINFELYEQLSQFHDRNVTNNHRDDSCFQCISQKTGYGIYFID
jgi:hypothetical protein